MAEFKIVVNVSNDTNYNKPALSCHVKYFLANESIKKYVVDKLYDTILDELNKFALTILCGKKSTKLSITFDKSFIGDIIDCLINADEFDNTATGTELQWQLDPVVEGKLFINYLHKIPTPLWFTLDTVISYVYEYIGNNLYIDGQRCIVHFQSGEDIDKLIPMNVLYIPEALKCKLPYKDKELIEGVFTLNNVKV